MEPLDVASLLAEPAPLCWDRLHATNGPLDSPPPPAGGDALDQALPWLVRHLGVADALSAVLAADAEAQAEPGADADAHAGGHSDAPPAPDGDAGDAGRLQGALALIGIDAWLRPLHLGDLTPQRLPALLLLRGGDACVLANIRQRGGERLLRVVMPGRPPVAFELPQPALAAEYTGVALLLRRRPDGPAMQPPTPAQGPLARLALALQAALEPPAPLPAQAGGWPALQQAWQRLRSAATRWGGRFTAGRRPADGAFKFGPGRPISG